MNEKSYLGSFFEGLFFILILLVILETYAEELFAFMDYGVVWRNRLLFAGFGFDLVFTVEFITRLGRARARRGAGVYFLKEFGFVDLLSSIPLLLLVSAPLLLMSYFPGSSKFFASLGALSFLKAVKIVRVARTLRFLRTLKLFGKTRPRYIMTSRYVSRVLVIVIAVMILTLIGFSFLDGGKVIQSRSLETQRLVENYIKSEETPRFDLVLSGSDSVLFIEREREVLYQGIDREEFDRRFFDDDFSTSSINGYEVTFSTRDRTRLHAFINLLVYTMIVATIIAVSILFRGFFNKHISNSVGVMLKGFKTQAYSTPVRVRKQAYDLEIYQLADQYNRKWLSVKRRIVEIKQSKV
jgi:hypothetical protein